MACLTLNDLNNLNDLMTLPHVNFNFAGRHMKTAPFQIRYKNLIQV